MFGLRRACWIAARSATFCHSFSPSIPLPLKTRSRTTCSMPALPTLPARNVSPSGSSVSFLRSRYFPNSSGMFIGLLLGTTLRRRVAVPSLEREGGALTGSGATLDTPWPRSCQRKKRTLTPWPPLPHALTPAWERGNRPGLRAWEVGSLSLGRGLGRGRSDQLPPGPPLARPPVAKVLPLPDLDVAVVLLEAGGEDVGAVVAADEV